MNRSARREIEVLLSKALNYLCEQEGLSAAAIAGKVGVTPRTIEYARNKKNPRCGPGTAEKIARVFGMSYEELLSLGRWLNDGGDPSEWFRLIKNPIKLDERERSMVETLRMAGILDWLLHEEGQGSFPAALIQLTEVPRYREWAATYGSLEDNNER